MEKNNLYKRLISDIKSARRFRRKVLGIFEDEEIKPLDKLSAIFPKLDKDYTKEDGKNFILELCNSQQKWYYHSSPGYNYFISFNALKDNNVMVKKTKYYTNEGD